MATPMSTPPISFPFVNDKGIMNRGWSQYLGDMANHIVALETQNASLTIQLEALDARVTALENPVTP